MSLIENLSHVSLINPDQFSSRPRIELNLDVGRYSIRTLNSSTEIQLALSLRYQVFQVEMIGCDILQGIDTDMFDAISDHLGIFETKTKTLIATCRLNCSLFSNVFYTQQEFSCEELINRPDVKLEIGRVCVHRDHRKGIVVMLLWRAIAEYMKKTQTRFLFGCGSVATLDPFSAAILYRFLKVQGKVKSDFGITPTQKYKSCQFNDILKTTSDLLTSQETLQAQALLPSLCRSYFDIGCFTPSVPAFDQEFKCIDFLTVLDVENMDSHLRRKLLSM